MELVEEYSDVVPKAADGSPAGERDFVKVVMGLVVYDILQKPVFRLRRARHRNGSDLLAGRSGPDPMN